MIEVTESDSGFTPENIADAEWLWTNLPTFPRNWSSLPTHEKALVIHTAASHRTQAAKAAEAENARLREDIAEIIAFAETRRQDGIEMGAAIWRIALEDIIKDARKALEQQP